MKGDLPSPGPVYPYYACRPRGAAMDRSSRAIFSSLVPSSCSLFELFNRPLPVGCAFNFPCSTSRTRGQRIPGGTQAGGNKEIDLLSSCAQWNGFVMARQRRAAVPTGPITTSYPSHRSHGCPIRNSAIESRYLSPLHGLYRVPVVVVRRCTEPGRVRTVKMKRTRDLSSVAIA